MNTLSWEQKLAALQTLCETHLRMRKPGDWYVSANSRDIGGNGFLTGTYGNGASPEEAVNDDWEKMTSVPSGKYIAIGGGLNKGKCFRWGGFMWLDVTPHAAAAPSSGT